MRKNLCIKGMLKLFKNEDIVEVLNIYSGISHETDGVQQTNCIASLFVSDAGYISIVEEQRDWISS